MVLDFCPIVVAVRVTADDEIVVLCQHDHVPLSFRKVILDGTGLEEVTCRGSTVRVPPQGAQAPEQAKTSGPGRCRPLKGRVQRKARLPAAQQHRVVGGLLDQSADRGEVLEIPSQWPGWDGPRAGRAVG